MTETSRTGEPEEIILKVQIPLVTDDPNPDAMIYDESRRILTLIPTESVMGYFAPGEHKVYVYGSLRGTILHLGELAPEQLW